MLNLIAGLKDIFTCASVRYRDGGGSSYHFINNEGLVWLCSDPGSVVHWA